MIYAARVIVGKGRGRRIGIPTVNLMIPKRFPYRHGIYAGAVFIGGVAYAAAIHFGPIPTFREAAPTLEAHFIDIVPMRIPAVMKFEFIVFLREIRIFPDAASLLVQVRKDIKNAREAYRASRSH